MKKHHTFHVRLASLALAVLLLVATVAPAAGASQAESAVSSITGSDVTDPAAVEAFFDRELPASMARNDVPGGVLTVVHDGEVVLLRGYGHADVETATPVNPHTTVFHTGSVAKVVTTTGVMQLAEAGEVDLDTDVSEYVDVDIPDTYDDPITLRQLATHTSGFDYVNDGVLATDPAAVPTVETVVKTELPARVREPGVVSTYDNHGWALMGYVLERQSGRAYATYTREELFEPLGMTHSSSVGVLPADLQADLATGYHVEGGELVVADPVYVRLAPAGSFATTGADMGQFLRANLEGGCVDGRCILDSGSVDELHATQFRGSSDVPGMAFGYEEYDRNGQRVLGKGGDDSVFSADMWLLPDHEFGVFMAFNAPGGATVRNEVYAAFMDEFFPVEDASLTGIVPGFDDRAAEIVGEYRLSRVSETDHTKFMGLIEVISVQAVGEGVLSLSIGGQIAEYVEVEPYVFEAREGANRIAFVSHDGETYLVTSGFPADHLRKVGPTERPLVHFAVLGVSLLVALSGLVGWPVSALYRRVRRGRRPKHIEHDRDTTVVRSDGGRRLSATVTSARFFAGTATLAVLGTFAGLVYMFATDSIAFGVGIHPLLGPVTALPVVAGLLLIGAAVTGFSARSAPGWSRLGKVHFALVVVAVGIVLVWLVAYNLVVV
ncbi:MULTISPECIES: serine hydrolase [Haloferax]|uniref:Serine hydrolase n=1 Tax=Haloferax marinum TaxID=2666143 RepID=A0A6A8G7J3_9EURY|nr:MULTISPECIES: serine hydrolase domain-containing protein [Haloferax]KAB1197214.1 beta-lactamase family protein [Haloferax sp. CBA1150]MRW96253.1 serine hydrolase [Haloferax marinum]